jgi:uncharacterized protein
MKRLILSALICSAAMAHAQTPASAASSALPSSPAKKELVQKWLALQQPAVENLARGLVDQSIGQMTQGVGQFLQTQVPADKRDAVAKTLQADFKKYVDDALPLVRDRAVKLAPSTIGAQLEDRFTEEELRQLLAWLDSPVNKKYQAFNQDIGATFQQRMVTDARPILEPRLQALELKVRGDLGLPPPGTTPPGSGGAAAKAPAPAKKASGSK